MGRTLFYGVIDKVYPNKEQNDALTALMTRYREDYEWTCESVFLTNTIHKPKDEIDENEYSSLPNSDLELSRIKEKIDDKASNFEIHTLCASKYVEIKNSGKLYGSTKVMGRSRSTLLSYSNQKWVC